MPRIAQVGLNPTFTTRQLVLLAILALYLSYTISTMTGSIEVDIVLVNHEEHDQEHEVTRDTSRLMVVNVDSGLLPNFYMED